MSSGSGATDETSSRRRNVALVMSDCNILLCADPFPYYNTVGVVGFSSVLLYTCLSTPTTKPLGLLGERVVVGSRMVGGYFNITAAPLNAPYYIYRYDDCQSKMINDHNNREQEPEMRETSEFFLRTTISMRCH